MKKILNKYVVIPALVLLAIGGYFLMPIVASNTRNVEPKAVVTAAIAPASSPQATLAALDLGEAAEKFLEKLSNQKIMAEYDEAKLRKAIEQFNQSQNKKFKIDPETYSLPAENYTQLKFEDQGEYLVLLMSKVTAAHTDGVDGGEDSYFSIFFTKHPLKEISRLEGPTYRFANPSLQLTVPAKSSCMGQVPMGRLSVHDLRDQSEYFSGSLPDGTLAFEYGTTQKATEAEFTTNSEAPSPSRDSEEHHCDVGEWVQKISTRFKLVCDPEKHECSMKQTGQEITEGCQDIGGCD